MLLKAFEVINHKKEKVRNVVTQLRVVEQVFWFLFDWVELVFAVVENGAPGIKVAAVADVWAEHVRPDLLEVGVDFFDFVGFQKNEGHKGNKTAFLSDIFQVTTMSLNRWKGCL